MSARDELRDCFLSDSRDRFDAAAAAYQLEVIAERDAQIIAWLGKKAREYRSTRSRQHALQADAIETMADKLGRGAVRPPLSSANAQLLTDAERFPGELAMMRGLLGVLRVVAKHGPDDMAEVRRLLAEHASDEQAAYTRGGDDRG